MDGAADAAARRVVARVLCAAGCARPPAEAGRAERARRDPPHAHEAADLHGQPPAAAVRHRRRATRDRRARAPAAARPAGGADDELPVRHRHRARRGDAGGPRAARPRQRARDRRRRHRPDADRAARDGPRLQRRDRHGRVDVAAGRGDADLPARADAPARRAAVGRRGVRGPGAVLEHVRAAIRARAGRIRRAAVEARAAARRSVGRHGGAGRRLVLPAQQAPLRVVPRQRLPEAPERRANRQAPVPRGARRPAHLPPHDGPAVGRLGAREPAAALARLRRRRGRAPRRRRPRHRRRPGRQAPRATGARDGDHLGLPRGLLPDRVHLGGRLRVDRRQRARPLPVPAAARRRHPRGRRLRAAAVDPDADRAGVVGDRRTCCCCTGS